MKIFQVITLSELGGAQVVVTNLANFLSQEHEVIVVAGEGDGKMWNLLSPIIKQERVPTLQRALSPLKELRTVFAFRKLYKKYKPDIIHLHSSKAGILGRVAFPKNKIIYTVHGFDSIRIAYRKFLPLERFLQNQCQAIVGVSKYDVQNLKAEGITHNVSIVYNGIPPFLPLEGNTSFSQIKGYEAKILCIARLAPPKNVGLFLEVAALLPQYAFIWIGNRQEITFQYPSNVYFMGNLPNAGACNKFVDLFMLPSDYEGLPIVIIEALACGKPVVASNVGGVSELLNGKNGFAVQNDARQMADKICFILSNKEIYQEMAGEAYKTYVQFFTIDKMLNGYVEIYKRCLSGL